MSELSFLPDTSLQETSVWDVDDVSAEQEPQGATEVQLDFDVEEAAGEVKVLTERLENAENELLLAASLIMHLSTIHDIGDKIESMKPSPLESEGEDIRQSIWTMGKRVTAIENAHRRHTSKLSKASKGSEDMDKMRRSHADKTSIDKLKMDNGEMHDMKKEEIALEVANEIFIKSTGPHTKRKVNSPTKDGQDNPMKESIKSSGSLTNKGTEREEKNQEKEITNNSGSLRSVGKPNSPTVHVFPADITMIEVAKEFRSLICDARKKCQDAHKIFNVFSERVNGLKENCIPLDSLCQCANEIANMKSALNALTGGQFESGGDVDFVHNKRLKKSENLLDSFNKRIRKIGNVKRRIDKFKTHEKDMIDSLKILFRRLDSGLPLRTGAMDNTSKIQHLFKMIHQVEQDVKNVSEVPNKLRESEIQRDAAVDAIEECVELLSTIKLDKADLEDALNEKVDKMDLEQKVPKIELKKLCNNLSDIIDNNEECFWRREATRDKTKDTIQRQLSCKVDIDEFENIQKFKDKVLNKLEKKIKKIPPAESQVEAAGTKKPLTHVCCRCKERPSIVLRRLVPGGITPYHAYEKYAIDRKQRGLFSTTKADINEAEFANSWEQALQSQIPAKKKRPYRRIRRCGGLHTTTLPPQRVTRLVPFDTYSPCPACLREA